MKFKATHRDHRCLVIASVCMLLVGLAESAAADIANDSSLTQMVEHLQKQVAELQSTVTQQAGKIRQLENRGLEVRPIPSGDAGTSEQEFNEQFDLQLKDKIGTSDTWLKDLDFKGDLRLRWDPSDRTDGPDKANDRNRFRYRLRFGWDKNFRPDMMVGFGLASQAANTEATSTNTSFDDSFTFKPISIEKAYATYKPVWAEFGPITEVELTGGKFQNPYLEGSSKIIWDGDVTPEGLYEKVTVKPVDTTDADLYVYGIAGQLILEEEGGSGDAELYAYQFGVKPVIDVGMTKPIESKHVFSFYEYSDFVNTISDGGTAVANGNPTPNTETGTGFAAGSFGIVEVYNEVKIVPFSSKYPITWFFDWATNAQNKALDFQGGGRDKAWAMGWKLGKAKERHTWELGYEYRYVEPNAVVGQFVDGDFGFVNKRGSVISGTYALTDDLTAGISGYFTNNITADSLLGGIPAANTRDEETRLFLVDMVWTF